MGNAIRVLLVDDDDAVADLTATYLQRANDAIEPVVETSPVDALDRVTAGERIDCVVSDYEMPEMDGLELLASVREADSDVPFVLFTGKGSEEIASEAISAGVTDYLQKETGTEQYEVLANRVENAVSQYHAEREAEQADEQIRRIFERITDAFFALDDEWQFRYVNERAAAFFDRDPDDLLGEDIRAAFDAGMNDEFYDAFREAFETQEPVTVEARSEFRPGNWLEVRVYPAEDGLSVYFRNVTDRHEARAELRNTKQKIEALHDVAARAVACDTEQEVYDLAIESAEEILAFDLCTVDAVEGDVLVTKAVSNVVDTDGYYEQTPIDADDTYASRVYRTGESSLVDDIHAADVDPAESAYRAALTVPIGEYGIFQAVSRESAAFDEDDRELAELLAAHIAEALARVRTETELRAERDRFAALFENVPNAVVRYEIDGLDAVARSVNPAFEAVFGWSGDDIEGDPVDDYILPPDREQEGEELNQRVEAGHRIEGAEVHRMTTQGGRDFLLHTAPAGNGGEEAFAIYVDITEQKERERQLARQNERLEEFASVVSHDLRSPLNVARGRFDLLAEDCDSEHLDPIARSLDRMDSLVEDLLALARQGQVVDETEPVSLSNVGDTAWHTVDTGEASLIFAADDLVVEADEARFRELLENLFRNAVEHGSTGSRTRSDDAVEHGSTSSQPSADDAVEHGHDAVRVEIGPLDDGRGFYVADDGPGIPPDERDEVFEHGYTTAEDGTGFGLAIVSSIAEAHGWEAEIAESESGGARFEFSRVGIREAD